MARVFTLLEIDLGGDIRRFIDHGEAAVTLTDRLGNNTYHYETGAIIEGLPGRGVDILGGGTPGSSASVTLWGPVTVDLWRLSNEAPIQTVVGRLYWWELGAPYEERVEVHRGAIRSPVFSFTPPRVTFSLEPPQRRGDIAFPPASVGDDGRFPEAPDNAKPNPVPIIYGAVRGVPLYAVTDVAALTIRLILAGHTIASTDIDVRDSEGVVVGAALPVLVAVDGDGGVYSYVEIPMATYTTNANLHAEEIQGKPDPGVPGGGTAMSGLGDVLLDMWHSYSREEFFALDRSRVYAARPLLNRYRIGACFNERIDTGTLFDAMSSRFADAFPVAFNYTGGRLGWDCVRIPNPDDAFEPSWSLIYQQDAWDRGPVTETPIDEVRHKFVMQYGFDGFEQGESQGLTLDENNHGAARRSKSRYGEAPLIRFRAPDLHTQGDAYVLLADKAEPMTRIRRRVTYSALPSEFNDLPLMSIGLVTDHETGWDEEPFLIESIQPRLDGTVDIGLVSLLGL